MKPHKALFMVLAMFLLASSASVVRADDFDWIGYLNLRAETDLSSFRTRLSARFKIGDAQVEAVLSNVERPADAYMILRLGELSHKSPDYVIERYRSEKSRGWGTLAKSLGIKPGSQEFHALKRGDDLYAGKDQGKTTGKGNGKSKGKGKK